MKKEKVKAEVKISVIALIISFFSLITSVGIPYIQFKYEMLKEAEDQMENIDVIFSSLQYASKATYSKSNVHSTLSGIQYVVYLCNISKQRISIIDANLNVLNDLSFFNVIQGFFDINETPILLPIVLEPGEAKKIIIDTLLVVENDNNDESLNQITNHGIMYYIESFIKNETTEFNGDFTNIEFKLNDLQKYLVDKNLDIFGNLLDLYDDVNINQIAISNAIFNYREYGKTFLGQTYGGGAFSFPKTKGKFPEYVFQVTTAKHNYTNIAYFTLTYY